MQWGLSQSIGGSTTISFNFPIPFPHACLNAQTSSTSPTDSPPQIAGFNAATLWLRNQAAAWVYNSASTEPFYWMAIGW